jgi:type III secretion protein V
MASARERRAPGSRYAAPAVIAVVVLSVSMMIVPLPSVLLDLLICLDLVLAGTLLFLALRVGSALQIASFPSLLLLSTLFRLAIEVSATRLILLDADAGQVIYAFGSFVVAGNLVVGSVMFVIVTTVQLIVVAKGAERVAEVGARFALDALPGRQMAIDAELRVGHIDAQEARHRRQLLARESHFFGAMDGAMKFVKGDAIAGVVILATNIVGGLLVGVVQRGLALSSAAHTYTLLTIGEGLAAQIPALIITTAAGLLVTRESDPSDHEDHATYPAHASDPRSLAPSAIELELAPFLGKAEHQRLQRELLPRLRERFLRETGLTLFELDLARAQHGPPGTYTVRLRGVAVATGRVPAGASERKAEELIAEHLAELLRRHGHTLLGLDQTQALLDRLVETHPALVRETVPKVVSLALLAEILRALFQEGISLRYLAQVLESLSRRAPLRGSPAELAEGTRAELQGQITAQVAQADGSVAAFVVDASIETTLRESIRTVAAEPRLALEPDLGRDIVAAVGRAVAGVARPVLVTSADLRRHLRGLIAPKHPQIAVVAYHELLPEVELRTQGRITV